MMLVKRTLQSTVSEGGTALWNRPSVFQYAQMVRHLWPFYGARVLMIEWLVNRAHKHGADSSAPREHRADKERGLRVDC